MLVILSIAIVLVCAGIAHVLTVRLRRRPPARRNPIAQVICGREFRALDEHLEAINREELGRLDEELSRYLAGRAGRVVVASRARHGIALELSDGRRLMLGGISTHAVELLHRRAPLDMLRPESVHRDAISCRLLFRGPAGDEVRIYARNVVLGE